MNSGVNPGEVLIVDDHPDNLDLLTGILREHLFAVRVATDGQRALRSAQSVPPDVVLLDVNMPRMDGYEVCRELKRNPQTRDIPVIFVSAYGEVFDKVKAFSLGGADYITKPFHVEEVLARTANQLKIRRFQKELEARNAELSKAYKRVEEASQAKSRFLAMVSQELRVPLTAIVGYCDLLIEEEEDLSREELEPVLERIREATRSQLDLINDILDFTKLEAHEVALSLEPFRVEDVISTSLDIVAPLAKKNANTLEGKCSEDLGQMLSDPARVQEILVNVLSNANKFTRNGFVRITATPLLLRGDVPHVSFTITDSGIGMTAEQCRRLFQPFTQAEEKAFRRYGGTGLGLAISRRIADLLKGEITVESEPGRGTTFRVVLPAEISA